MPPPRFFSRVEYLLNRGLVPRLQSDSILTELCTVDGGNDNYMSAFYAELSIFHLVRLQ